MACKTESLFDRLTKIAASGVSRREVFKYAGAAVFGAALSTVGVRKAHADRFCPDGCPGCPAGVSCRQHANGTLCYCFQKARNPVECKCLGDFACAGALPCNTNAECKAALGRGAKCIATSCCGVKSCAPKCGQGVAATSSGAKASGT
jgi:hypothetical protein